MIRLMSINSRGFGASGIFGSHSNGRNDGRDVLHFRRRRLQSARSQEYEDGLEALDEEAVLAS